MVTRIANHALLLLAFSSSIAVAAPPSNFTRQALKDGRLMVGGVVYQASDKHQNENFESRAQAEKFEKQLAGARKDLRIDSAAALSKAIGASQYAQMMGHYKSKGELTEAMVNALGKAKLAARYVAFLRVVSDETTNRRLEKKRETEDREVVEAPEKTYTYAERKLGVKFRVYDVKNDKQAFQGTFSGSAIAEMEHRYIADSSMNSMMRAAAFDFGRTKDKWYPNPDPPKIEAALKNVYAKIITELP